MLKPPEAVQLESPFKGKRGVARIVQAFFNSLAGLADAWRPYLEWIGTWLEVLHGEGPEAVEGAYLDLLDGRIDPAQAHVLSLPR